MPKPDGRAMEQAEFKGYVVAKLEDVSTDITDLKENNKEQWQAIRKSSLWNKVAGAVATAALIVAGYFGIGRK